MSTSASKQQNLGISSECLDLVRRGDLDGVYDLLPRLGICKDEGLLSVFGELLFSGDRKREELAVCAMAAIGKADAVPVLLSKFEDASLFRGPRSQKLQTAILDAIGEIGDDSASPKLLCLFHMEVVRDTFRRKRRAVILDTMGAIAQQGGDQAIQILVDLLSHEDFLVRAHAVTNLSTAYWQRPNEIPPEIFDRLLSLFRDSNPYVQYSLISAMENLADIGCRAATELFNS